MDVLFSACFVVSVYAIYTLRREFVTGPNPEFPGLDVVYVIRMTFISRKGCPLQDPTSIEAQYRVLWWPSGLFPDVTTRYV